MIFILMGLLTPPLDAKPQYYLVGFSIKHTGAPVECKCSTKTATTNAGNIIGNCLTASSTGRGHFCYVPKASGCCEGKTARFRDFCTNFSLCDVSYDDVEEVFLDRH